MGENEDITARQEHIVRMALDLGFFEFPRKINLESLSERLNISLTTLSEIIRRESKHIMQTIPVTLNISVFHESRVNVQTHKT